MPKCKDPLCPQVLAALEPEKMTDDQLLQTVINNSENAPQREQEMCEQVRAMWLEAKGPVEGRLKWREGMVQIVHNGRKEWGPKESRYHDHTDYDAILAKR